MIVLCYLSLSLSLSLIYIYISSVFCPRADPSRKLRHQAILPKGRSSIANSGTQVAVLLGMNRCGSFLLLSASHSLFSIWTNLKRFEKFPGSPTRRWEEWIWLTGPSGLHRHSPQGLNISSIRVLTRSEIRKSQLPFAPRYIYNLCSAQGQVLHCKLRHQAILIKGRSFMANSGT